MLRTLGEFVSELRTIGVPVSMVESLDAAEALRHVDLGDREALRTALAATMIKRAEHREPFDVAFEVFFGPAAPGTPGADADGDGDEAAAAESDDGGDGGAEGRGEGTGRGSGRGGAGSGDREAEAIYAAVLAALVGGDDDALRAAASDAVEQLAGMQPGRPVGGRYYFYRVMRRVDGDQLRAALEEAARRRRRAPERTRDGAALDTRLAEEEAAHAVARFEAAVRREIIRRLVADRGRAAVAKTLRVTLAEDLDLMHATRDELAKVERAVTPLARKLASRLGRLRRRGRRGRLDVRKTIRRSLSHGGVFVDPAFRPPRVSKPEVVLITDVSGSMATFARFTMQLTHAISDQLSKVRTFAFIDDLDEVTRFFGAGADFHVAMARIAAEARLVWRDGHSDYGHALARFWEEYGDAVTPRSTVIVTGDARSNYRDPEVGILAAIAERARAVYWLNPEARRYWDTGDSVMGHYAPWCTEVHEVRTLRQLETFVARVALPPAAHRSAVVRSR